MKIIDVRPGMFIQYSESNMAPIVFIVRDDLKDRSWEVVDVKYLLGKRHIGYMAITQETLEYQGDIQAAKHRTIDSIFVGAEK